ncbi:MAG: efflux RND transporter permease subunit [Methylococcales bacterium]
MESVVRFSLKQRVFYNLMFIVLTVVGAVALFSLPSERFPNINFGEVVIATYFPGASPDEVETLVTREIEEVLESIQDIEWVKASSYPERSRIRLKFTDDSNYDALYNEVRFKVLNMLDELPEEIDPPNIRDTKIEDYLPVIAVNIAGDHDNRALTLIAKELKTALMQVSGIKEVQLSGEYEREFHIHLDPARLKTYGLSFDVVATALQNANISIPAGDFTNHSGEFIVKVDEKFRTRKQVVSTIIRRDSDGSFVRVADVISRAGLDYREPNVISSLNGNNSIVLQVIKTTSSSALDIKDSVLVAVTAFEPVATRHGVEVTLNQDSTVQIKDSLHTLGINMLVGIFLVMLIIWYFMGLRNAGLISIGIPFSFMITMIIMYVTGNSLNELTLFSFVLVTGIIVDDAIVVTENIYRHIQEGKPLEEAIVTGTTEVAVPVIAATMTTVAAFLPMLVMTGSTGEFFALIPKAVTFALIASLVECLLILPIHYLDLGPRPLEPNKDNPVGKDNSVLSVVRRLTGQLLSLTMRFRYSSIFVVFIAFLTAIAIFAVSISGTLPLIRIKFFPDDYSLYYVDLKGPTNTPIEVIDTGIKEISKFVINDGIGMAASTAGFAGFYMNEDYEQVFGNNYGTVVVTMPAKSDQTFDDPMTHLDNMREGLKKVFEKDGFTVHIHPQTDGPPTGKDLNVRVLGTDSDAIDSMASELFNYIRDNPDIGPHLVELEDDRGKPKQVFRFQLRHDRISEYNLDNTSVARLAASVLDGRYIGKFRLSDEEVDLKLYIDPKFMTEPEDALAVPLIEHASGPLRLGDVTYGKIENEPGEINRYQNRRAVSIKANIKTAAPTSTPAIVSKIKTFYESIRERYPGTSVIFGGEHEDTQRSYTSLTHAFIIAVLIMYVILAAQFQSYLQPLIILSAIIFALVGVVFGKLITQSLFTVNSFIAVIGVAGVVVNDSLVLIDFINKSYRSGMTRREAIEKGVHTRLRPILLTTLTTTLALLPMAIGIPSYSPVWGAMASTFVAGLATATTLTLFIVPVLWDLVQGLQERGEKRQLI